MKTIYKHIIKIEDTTTLEVPLYSSIIKIARQGDQICAWVKGDTTRPLTPITLRIFGTGHALPEDEMLTFMDTVIMDHFVWHIFLKDTPA